LSVNRNIYIENGGGGGGGVTGENINIELADF